MHVKKAAAPPLHDCLILTYITTRKFLRYCTLTEVRLICGYGNCDVITMSNVTVPDALGVV